MNTAEQSTAATSASTAPAPVPSPAATLARFDPEAVTRAVHRAMDCMKAEIIEEILRETHK